MEHNPYYDESLGQSRIDPNAALYAAQLHALQVQETERLRQLDLQAHQGFAGLQAVSNQHAPQQHHQGTDWGTMAAVGTLAYLAARNSQQAPAQSFQARPIGWKGNVWGWYFALALLIQLAIWPSIAIATIDGGEVSAFLLLGTAIWAPAWLVIYLHQRRIREHNRKLVQP
jgi:hypothetical protein